MTASFVAYIDESGDEGFRFREKPRHAGSSDWFVLAAFVTRKRTDIGSVKIIDQVRAELGLPPGKHVHWKKLRHQQKVRYAQMLIIPGVRIIAVCVHKPSLLEPEKFQERYVLYYYAVRYLMERLSWLIRDAHNPEKWGGDGTIKTIFSNRQGMSYEEMREYLRKLKQTKESGKDIRIDFSRAIIEKISTQTPGKSMGLQLADAAAGAIFNGLERDPFGNTEPRYAETLSPVLYRHQGILDGYGVKLVPREAKQLVSGDPCLAWLPRMMEKRKAGPGP